MMQVEHVDFINVPTRDTKRAFAFYRDVLGLPVDPNNSQELRAGQVTLTFWEPESEGFEFKEDVDASRPRARRRGGAGRARGEGRQVRVGSGDTGVCHMASSSTPTATP